MSSLPDIYYIERNLSMRGIQSSKNRICLRAVLLIFICVLLFSLFSSIGDSLIMQDLQATGINQDSGTPRGIGRVHQNPLADILITSFYQDTQRLTSCKNNSFMTSFYGSVYGLFFHTTARFISLSDQISTFTISNFLTALYCPNAPPCIFS